MKKNSAKEQRTTQRLCRTAVGVMLLQLSAASADPFVPGTWVRAAEQHAADKQMIDAFSGVDVIAMDELGAMRGGLELAGLNIDVGAVVRTIVDGQLALESHISLATASEIAAAIGADPRFGINPAPLVTAATNNAGQAEGIANSPAANAAAPTTANNVSMPIQSANGAATTQANRSNVVINDAKGLTQIIHDVTRNRVVSAIVNQADGRTIRQEMDINITVSNFREIQRAAAQQRVSRALGGAGL